MKELEIQNIYNKCIVDDEDYDKFLNIKLNASKNGHLEYWNNAKRHWIHREILSVSDKNLMVDHIDGNPLNNQKSNLRICKRSGNAKNLKISSRNTSGYKGVSFYKNTHKWNARILSDGAEIKLGYFKTKKDAAKAYDEASKKYHGKFGVTNFELKKRNSIEILWKPNKFDDPDLKPGMIPLGNKKYAYVDLKDYEKVMRYSWHMSSGYALSQINKKTTYLHRFIMNPKKEEFIDHINGDKLNCKKENLRICTKKENTHNTKSYIRKNRTSKFKGISFRIKNTKNPWQARVCEDIIGNFNTEQNAAIAYNKEAVKRYGEFAYLNKV